MRFLVFGSLNIDHVYEVNHIVAPGETTRTLRYRLSPGGKGLNQAIALAKAGLTVHMAGKVGSFATKSGVADVRIIWIIY